MTRIYHVLRPSGTVDIVRASYCFHEASGALNFTHYEPPNYHISTVMAYAPDQWITMKEVTDDRDTGSIDTADSAGDDL